MAEINVADLPVTPSGEFTQNDSFLIINDGKTQLLNRDTFQTWMLANVQGQKGDQGIQGIAGLNGSNGWSPVLAVVPNGEKRVLQIYGWTGGTGATPSSGQYISATGLTSDINAATDIRGQQGIQGIQGVQGLKGDQGIQGIQGVAGQDGKDGVDGIDAAQATTLTFLADQSLKVDYNNGTTLYSNIPPATYGWGTYKDSQYTDVAPFAVSAGTQVTLPNNGINKIEYLPTGVTTFFDSVNNKYLIADNKGFYTVRVRFKVAASNQADYVNISFSKNTTETPYDEDRLVRGDNTIHYMNFSTVLYGDNDFVTNGLTVKLKTYTRAVSIYNIEVTISKII